MELILFFHEGKPLLHEFQSFLNFKLEVEDKLVVVEKLLEFLVIFPIGMASGHDKLFTVRGLVVNGTEPLELLATLQIKPELHKEQQH